MGIMMGIMVVAMAAGFFIFDHHENMMGEHSKQEQKEELIVNGDKNKKENYNVEEREK